MKIDFRAKAGIRELLFNKPQYNETLRRYFTENTVFFYGYSFNDPDIDFILQGIMADKKGLTRKHYALLPNVGEIEAEYLLKEYNLNFPIGFSKHVDIIALQMA